MCLILVVWRVHPEYPCVIAANRDEFHRRAAGRAEWWPDKPRILGGRDLAAGGTWLGMTRAGRFAALTNFRSPAPNRSDVPSRGALVTRLLESSGSLRDDLSWLSDVGPRYNGFNVILSDGERLGIYESVRGKGRELSPGVYGLSNDLLDTPWPKVQRAKSSLHSALDGLADTAAVLALLRDDRPAPDHLLPRTGISLEWERLLSSAFVRSPDYGTRCSTIVRIDRTGDVNFDEWSWDPAGEEIDLASVKFQLSDG